MADPVANSDSPLYGTVYSDFVVPAQPECLSEAHTAVSIWAGMGGYYNAPSQDPLYQAGVLERCDDGAETIRAFYEQEPSATGPQFITNSVSAGDRMLIEVSPGGYYRVNVTIQDWGSDPTHTIYNWTETDELDLDTQLAPLTQECIVEAPYDPTTNTDVPLMNFGSVEFPSTSFDGMPFHQGCMVNDANTNSDHVIGSTSPGVKVSRITMEEFAVSLLADVDDPSTDGDFGVNWDAASY